jgi:hypothetical protein
VISSESRDALFARLSQQNTCRVLLAIVAAVSCLAVYVPFWVGDPSIPVRYWDGPNYLYVAKTLYDIPADHPLAAYGNPPAYFACHLPVYPLAIRLLSFLGYPAGMLAATALFTVLATLAFYHLLIESRAVTHPLWSALVSLFLPARWLLYHSVGATEAPFLFFVFLSMLAYLRGHYGAAFLLAGISGITRITGLLLGLVYLVLLLREKKWSKLPLLALVAAPVLLLFAFYQHQFGDFFAYFSENARLLRWRPVDVYFAILGMGDAHSAEFHFVLYGIYGIGALLLWRFPLFFAYSAVFYLFNLLLFHEDVSRMMIPIAPFALIVAYDPIIRTRAFAVAAIGLVVLSYIYVWGMLPHNIVTEDTWRKLLEEL